ncbi:MAG: thiamine phosphate synthase, partial [Candidatus Latescibacteria bacterium]|nr:thiamine phosphate synthase [Candidatus Latescibacterota bacterium]
VYEAGRIVHVGLKFEGTIDREIDARGKLVVPGFIDTHVHSGHRASHRLITDVGRPDFFGQPFLEKALAAQDEGASYVGVGHVFATTSKVKSTEPAGLDAISRVSARLSIPVIAIGGISEANAASVIKAGAWGIAVIGAVCATEDPRAATARLREIVEKREG